MQNQLIIAIVIISVLTILSPWVRAWDARRTSYLKGRSYDQAVAYLNRLQPTDSDPFKVVQITKYEQIQIHGTKFFFTISLGALNSLTEEELVFALKQYFLYIGMKSKFLTLLPIGITGMMLTAFLETNLHWSIPDWVNTTIIVGCGPASILFLSLFNEKFGVKADSKALEVTRNQSAALSYLEKLLVASMSHSIESVTKSLKARIENLKNQQINPTSASTHTNL